MGDKFLIIAITSPGIVPGEGARICEILRRNEAAIVHLRKPNWSWGETAQLLDRISPDLYSRIKIHDHFNLLNHYPLMGVHLNARNPVAPENARCVSRSFHTLEELQDAGEYDYVTLSPVFDSISKNGYKSAFSLKELPPFLSGKKVIALGGVTPSKFPDLRAAGFFGAAMLGYFWNGWISENHLSSHKF